MGADGINDESAFFGWRETRESKKDDAGREALLAEDQVAKVFVSGEEYAEVGVCQVLHARVRQPCSFVGHLARVMAGPAESSDNDLFDAFVGEKLHFPRGGG